MKDFLLNLQKGQTISVTVIEIQNDQQILVSYRGELFRVRNTSGKRFDVGEQMYLVVAQKEPLEFSLAGGQRLFSRMV